MGGNFITNFERRRIPAIVLLTLPALLGQKASQANREVGSKACAGCHAEIYRKYALTAMARSSGRITTASASESFEHASFAVSGAEYAVSPVPNGFRLTFSRPSTGVEGQRVLEWFVGSGAVGRSYLFSTEGFLFQAPVSYYTSRAGWGISPGFDRKPAIDLTRGVEAACLQCHASRLQPVAGTQNRFEIPPFLEGGVSCERCHGPGRNHIETMNRAPRSSFRAIVNPSKLDAERRESVCAQCHLTGAARVARARSGAEIYKPGGLLSDHLAIFVWSGSKSSDVDATSHFEKLQQSACKKASGVKLWCGTCHDPHSQPAPQQPVAFYRERCQTCHATSACKETKQARTAVGDNCIECHMPNRKTPTMEHVAFTDHAIPRRPATAAPSPQRNLESFWPGASPGVRDTALAYAIAGMSEPRVRRQALDLLQQAEATNPKDIPVLVQLAQYYDRMGNEEKATDLCDRIVRLDPSQSAAAINLGIYRMNRGRAKEAMDLWAAALKRNPALSSARLNLGVAQYRTGAISAAIETLKTALLYDPDLATARKLLNEIELSTNTR